ncbi:MAG: hypothetical protein NTW50_05235 [Candidatus Berkelbacteria bacterium]|nr:hypothetical protein [Candidatus Berkelbacteria bacterium]
MNCREVSDKIMSFRDLIDNFDRDFDLVKISDCKVHKSKFQESWLETMSKINDPFENYLRDEIAKREGFQFVEPFHGDLSWARYNDADGSHLWIIDRTGTKFSEDLGKFRHTPFYQGTAWIWEQSDREPIGNSNSTLLRLINQNGVTEKMIYVSGVDEENFENTGLIIVNEKMPRSGSRKYFLDDTGGINFKLGRVAYEPLTMMREGRAWVYFSDASTHLIRLIDQSNEEIVTPSNFSLECQAFSDGVSWVGDGKRKYWQLYDAAGEVLFEKRDVVEPFEFHEDRAFVKKGIYLDEKYFLIDKTGAELAGPFDYTPGFFDHGVSGVKQGDKWFLIDKSGNRIDNKNYREIKNFRNGIFFVSGEGGWHLINHRGNEISEQRYLKPMISANHLRYDNLVDVCDAAGPGKWFGQINEWGQRFFGKK